MPNINSAAAANRAWRFGFIVLKSSIAPPESLRRWICLKHGAYKIYMHHETSFHLTQHAGATALLIGEAFVCHGEGEVADHLSQLLRSNSYSPLDALSGRFALLIIEDQECRVVTDAFGARSVYYRLSGEVGISSHSSLLADVFSEQVDEQARNFRSLPEYKQRGTGYLPGDATMFSNIKCLIPNNVYSAESRKCERFWPRSDIPSSSVRSFLDLCDEYFSSFSVFLRHRYEKVWLGLTGGVDARAVIAGLNAFGTPLHLVTWTGNRLPAREVPVVEEMSRHLGLPHTYLDLTEKVPSGGPKEISVAASLATGLSRGRSGLSAHMSKICGREDVFVRGYGGEIIRGFYSLHRSKLTGDMGADFYRLYKTKRVVEPSTAFAEFCRQAINGYIDRANYDAAMFNADIRDVYYWEQRMGNWGSNMHNEMDPAVYSITGFNSRRLYESAFGLPEGDRLGSEIMLEIANKYDPALAKMIVKS